MDVAALRQKLKMDSLRERLRADSASQVAADEATAPQYKNETPDWFNYKDRLAVKNLADSPEQTITYLQKQYPDAEFTNNGDEVFMRKKGTKDYGRLDPEGMGDWLKDAGDLAYDGVQMGAEALGAAGGAIAGSAVAPVAGTFAGLSLGAGAGSGAASALRQKLAEALGVKQEADYSEAGKDALIGAAIPSVFKGAGKVFQAGKKVLPKVYGSAIGLTRGAMDDVADEGLRAWDNQTVTNKFRELKDDVANYVGKQQDGFAEEYAKRRGGDGTVDFDPINSAMNDDIAEAAAAVNRTDSGALAGIKGSLQNMKDDFLGKVDAQGNPMGRRAFDVVDGGATRSADEYAFDPIMGTTKKSGAYAKGDNIYKQGDVVDRDYLSGKIGVKDAMTLRSLLKKYYMQFGSDVGGTIGKGTEATEMSAKKLEKMLREQIAGGSDELGKRYDSHIDQVDFLKKNFETPEKVESYLKNFNIGRQRSLLGQTEELADPALVNKITDTANKVEAFKYINPAKASTNWQMGQQFITGRTPIEKLLTTAGTLGGTVMGGPAVGFMAGTAGRGIGAALANPKTVKAFVDAGKKLSKAEKKMLKKIQDNPEILNVIYGGANSLNE